MAVEVLVTGDVRKPGVLENARDVWALFPSDFNKNAAIWGQVIDGPLSEDFVRCQSVAAWGEGQVWIIICFPAVE